ncbi:MAG: hypothetical protein GXY76_09180 [Chloroflexi bacterium]|nr:hypothetical protein [Chloroflexota bacterium]
MSSGIKQFPDMDKFDKIIFQLGEAEKVANSIQAKSGKDILDLISKAKAKAKQARDKLVSASGAKKGE